MLSGRLVHFFLLYLLSVSYDPSEWKEDYVRKSKQKLQAASSVCSLGGCLSGKELHLMFSVCLRQQLQKSQSNADESLFTINQNITPVRAKKSMKPASVEMSTESYKDKQKRNRNSLVNTPTETHPNNPPTMRRLKRKKSQEPQEEAEQKIEILAEETQVVGIEFSDDSDCEESEMIVSTPNKKHTSILSGENPSETTPSNRKKTPENKKEKTPDSKKKTPQNKETTVKKKTPNSKKKTPQNKETTVKKKTPDSKKKKTLDSTAKVRFLCGELPKF